MRTIQLNAHSFLSKEILWQYISSVEAYPKYVPFVKKVSVPQTVTKNSVWHDVTSILWIPMRIPHKILMWEKEKKIVYGVTMPFGGTMTQEYTLASDKTGSRLQSIVSFDFGNAVSNIALGWILGKRLHFMLTTTLQNVERYHFQKKRITTGRS